MPVFMVVGKTQAYELIERAKGIIILIQQG